MSLDHILNKLAEKEMLKGNTQYAFKLITSADQKCSKCGAKSTKLVDKKGDMLCPDCFKPFKKSAALISLLAKYAQMSDFTPENDFTQDDFDNHMAQGWDAGNQDQEKNPYPLDSPQGIAWKQGYDEALQGKTQDFPDAEIGY